MNLDNDFGDEEVGRGSRDPDEASRFWSWVIRESEIAASEEGLVVRSEMECFVCRVKGSLGF